MKEEEWFSGQNIFSLALLGLKLQFCLIMTKSESALSFPTVKCRPHSITAEGGYISWRLPDMSMILKSHTLKGLNGCQIPFAVRLVCLVFDMSS